MTDWHVSMDDMLYFELISTIEVDGWTHNILYVVFTYRKSSFRYPIRCWPRFRSERQKWSIEPYL